MGICHGVTAQTETTQDKVVKTLLQDQEHLDIYYNEHVNDIMDVLETSDKLSLLYIMDSERTVDENG